MKNLLPLLVFSCIFSLSCQKETEDYSQQSSQLFKRQISTASPYIHPTAPKGSEISFHLKDSRLVLKDEHDFSKLLWSLHQEDLNIWEKNIQFTSYRYIHQLTSRDMHYEISSVLNAEGIIEVGSWLIKLDFKAKKVFVLPASLKHSAQILSVQYPTHPDLQIFDFDEDVWSAISTSANHTKGLLCKEPKAKNKYVSTTAASCICTSIYWQNTTISIRYNKFGIWETVKAFYYNNYYDVYGQNSNHFTAASLNNGAIQYHFDERCGSIYSGTYILPTGLFSNNTYVLRSSKKPLERNKSMVNMTVNTSYIINPPEPAQTLNTLLNNF